MSEFQRLDAADLDGLTNEQLVAYVVAAREAGEPELGKRAANIVAFRIQPPVEGRVAAKIRRDDRDDVVMATLESFLRSAFDGKVIDSVAAFVATIAKRRIADYYRDRERNPDQAPLPGENRDDESIWGEEPSVEDSSALLAIVDAVERVIARRSDLHARMIRLYAPEPMGGEDMTAAEVVERMLADDGTEVSADNVAQVWRRFKVELAKELSTGETGMDADG